VEKLSVALTSEMAEMIRHAVNAGEYASSSEVIREALRDWTYKRHARQAEIDSLRNLWNEGIESGAGRYADMDAIRDEARSRARKARQSGA
jgi:antitoxin ParD1/3/4